MSPLEIIERAAADGVVLALSDDNAITATGEQNCIDRWLPMIREQKAAIIDALLCFPARAADNLQKNDGNATCTTCEHLRMPGKSAGYCGDRDDLPLAYGINHPLRKLPEDGGASCDNWKGTNDENY